MKKPLAKTIIFCNDQTHALFMRYSLMKYNKEQFKTNENYAVRITSDEKEMGKNFLNKFKDDEQPYPVIVTTSELLVTGVDTKMVEVVVIDKIVNDKGLFKQMIGRGTRLNANLEQKGKTQFYVLDFNGTARKFLTDSDFDGKIQWLGTDKIKTPPSKPNKYTNSNANIIKHTLIGESEINMSSYTISLWREVNGTKTLITEEIEVFQRLKESKKLKEYLKALMDKEDTETNKERKEFLEKLKENGIFIDELKTLKHFENYDEFDILLSLSGSNPLSRKERAKKANSFLAELEPKARELMEFLLRKYIQNGFNEFNFTNFKNEPIASKYNLTTIKQILDSKGGFKAILRELKNALYDEVG
ncbi:type I restriction-modification enzyme R subunit C-terminal domain-containing protein [Campylobacter helveticus]|uniref:type I restriction-modification enzyme R subunit C-terminal domain-containing protein n=1 Tax=Campylobacter helveticus TaxID=28898 RepID=UPI00352FF582